MLWDEYVYDEGFPAWIGASANGYDLGIQAFDLICRKGIVLVDMIPLM